MTISYAAPEFFRKTVSNQSDQYALAVTYCHLRGGRLPFTGSLEELINGHLNQKPDLSMLPEAERSVVRKALSKNPQDRWPRCRAFLEALRAANAAEPRIAGYPAMAQTVPDTLPETVHDPDFPPIKPRGVGDDDDDAEPDSDKSEKHLRTLKRSRTLSWLTPVLILLAVLAVFALTTKGLLTSKNNEGDQVRLPPSLPKADDPSKRTDARRAGEETTNALGMTLCWCPPGTFIMGAPENEPESGPNENPVQVTLTRGFWLGKHEVTQHEWEAVMGPNPAHFRKGGESDKTKDTDTGQFPVESITHSQAREFCEKLTARERAAGKLPAGWLYRLPTEAQWEYACRAGTTTATAFGNALGGADANVNGDHPYNGADKGPFLERTTTVGRYSPNAWGLHDMHGNVYEWCQDAYQPALPGGDEPLATSAEKQADRVTRGGGWRNDASFARSAYRGSSSPSDQYNDLGFRAALVPVPAGSP